MGLDGRRSSAHPIRIRRCSSASRPRGSQELSIEHLVDVDPSIDSFSPSAPLPTEPIKRPRTKFGSPFRMVSLNRPEFTAKPSSKEDTIGVTQTFPLDHLITVLDDLLPLGHKKKEEIHHLPPHSQESFRTSFSHLMGDNYIDLIVKDSLKLLPSSLQDQIIKAYVAYVHPFLPVLNLPSFLGDIMTGNVTCFSSPLLYQAVMLAGSAFIEDSDVHIAGYLTRRDLREVLYERAKVLFEFGTENNAHVQVQSLLLMTLWHDHKGGHKTPSYWLDLAYTTAEKVKRGPGCLSLEDRIWWCVYLRDRIISLTFRRRPRIQDSASEISVLGSASPVYESYPSAVLDKLGETACMLTRDGQEQMAALFSQIVKLAHCLGIVIECLWHGTWITGLHGQTVHTLELVTNMSPIVVSRCEQLLNNWFHSLPHSARYSFSGTAFQSNTMALTAHKASLHLLYLTVTSITYRTGAAMDHFTSALYLEKMRLTTYQIKKTLTELLDTRLLLLLPDVAIATLLSFLECSRSELRGPDAGVRLQAMINIYTCEQAAVQLLQTYPSAQLILLAASDARADLLGLTET
ncbi:hypothetical protein BJX65DRAFT_319012 [Aspergillus insuetus]